MKITFKNIFLHCLVWMLVISTLTHAQEGRTVQTHVADVLALLPAKDNAEAERLFDELMDISDEGLNLIAAQVVPNGHEEGIPSRYAIALLTHYATTKDEKARIEKVYLNGLNRADNTEVKAYFIHNLKLIGSNAAIGPLVERIKEEGLTDQAVGALQSIGSPEARKALVTALEAARDASVQARLIQALGELEHQPATEVITGFAASSDAAVKKPALWALARIAEAGSYPVLLQSATDVGFMNDPSEATHALVEFLHQQLEKKNDALVTKASQAILSNTLKPEQQHFRLAALKALAKTSPGDATRTLVKEMNRFDPLYQKEVLKIAQLNASDPHALKTWTKAYRKSKGMQAEILMMLAGANRNDAFIESTLLPALHGKDASVRMAAAEEIAYSNNDKYKAEVVDYLLRAASEEEISAAQSALLRMMDRDDTQALAAKFAAANAAQQRAIINILAERRAVDHFDLVLENTTAQDANVRTAAYAALPAVASAKDVSPLLKLLARTENEDALKQVQAALIATINTDNRALVNQAYAQQKSKILPLLPYVNDEDALNKVKSAFESGNEQEKSAAFDAMLNWQNHEAARTLLAMRRNPDLKTYHKKAFSAFVSQVAKSDLADEQKRLMLEEAMTLAESREEKTAVIRAVGGLRSFLALVFVSKYLDDDALNRAASRAVMQIALPTPDARPGLTGSFVRATLQKILDKLEGQDSQYEVIDIQTYLANMPHTKGYESIFNGKDLSGWQGLVENPIARSKMSKAELARKQKAADEKLKESWSVKDGAIYFTGKGANLCTVRTYGDFEMLVDWKITRNGDSGIYLRGTPQVQIWDPTGKEEAAKVGSGGLYNNQKHQDKPLTVADNPVGEWNTFHIKMVGDKVTVHLNGVLVVDNVVMENYWDRSLPIFPEEAIELQAHGNELAFKNIFVKELGSKPYELTADEKKQGFELLFNGKDLDNWKGNKTDYIVEDNAIAIYPTGKGHGNLYTEKEYSDFVFRFEFQLTPGANNGLGIHTSLDGDAAYNGKEIQILDNTAPVYANLQPYQYHGSVYGIAPAKRGFLNPVGEWNEEEVIVKGDHVKVILNGTVILDADLKKATRNGTMDKKDHPGLKVHKGHIAFLGHGTIVRFRNIRVKDLAVNR